MHIGIVGGGIAGLTAAYRLASGGQQVTLWERSAKLGGQAISFDVAEGSLEYFYHHLFQSDIDITALIDELGLGHRLMWLPSNVGYFADGRILPLNGALDLLRLDILPFHDRIRIGLVTAYLQRVRDWDPFEQVTAEAWLRKALGDRAYEATFGAQLEAKFGRYASEIAMVWFWGKIWLRTTSRRSPLEGEKLGYPLGSFGSIVDALANASRSQGAVLNTGSGPSALSQTDDGRWKMEFDEGVSDQVYDRVIVTTPSPIFARLAPGLSDAYRQKITSLEYEAAVVALLELDRPLSSTYWMNIADPALPFTAVIEHTNFVSPRHYGGRHYVYLSKYLETDHPYFVKDSDALIDEYCQYLPSINPAFERSWMSNWWVFRERAAQPIITRNYSQRLPGHRTPLENLYLANTSQIYPEDRGTNYSVRLGNRIAAMVMDDAKTPAPWVSDN
ncbi:NAD(P)/FAD-dependent oxidoreductase [soil metagenome]